MTLDTELDAPLLPHWVTFVGAFVCCMATATGLMATTARGTQTDDPEGDLPGRCKSMRALCNFLCTRPSTMSCWKSMLLKFAILGAASLASTGLSLLVTNLTSNDQESITATIRIIIKEVLGVNEDTGHRLKRETTCFSSNDTAMRCPRVNSPCDPGTLLEADLDSELPVTCTILVFNILFATLAGMFLAVTAAGTLICTRLRSTCIPPQEMQRATLLGVEMNQNAPEAVTIHFPDEQVTISKGEAENREPNTEETRGEKDKPANPITTLVAVEQGLASV